MEPIFCVNLSQINWNKIRSHNNMLVTCNLCKSQSYGSSLVSACVSLYPEVIGEAKVLINNIILAIVKTVPRDQWPDLTPLLHILVKNLDEFSDYSKVRQMWLIIFY